MANLEKIFNRVQSEGLSKNLIQTLWASSKSTFYEDNVQTRKSYLIELIEECANAELNSTRCPCCGRHHL